jgi:hypothetical protein
MNDKDASSFLVESAGLSMKKIETEPIAAVTNK